jgi:hypothetical protein
MVCSNVGRDIIWRVLPTDFQNRILNLATGQLRLERYHYRGVLHTKWDRDWHFGSDCRALHGQGIQEREGASWRRPSSMPKRI